MPATVGAVTPEALQDASRRARLVLAAVWVLDGFLQFQPYMFTPAFGKQMLAGAAQGNPRVIAQPVVWAAGIIAEHPVATNALFATIQLALGLGIAFRGTVKPALAASIVWSVGVWWLGEGLGGVLTGSANPLSGAPGAVILYALLAVLLWPTPDNSKLSDRTWSFLAARSVGPKVAGALWALLWGFSAYLALQPANRSPQAVHDVITAMAEGQPAGLAHLEQAAGRALAGHGGPAAVILAVVFTIIAVGVFLPPPLTRAVLALTVLFAGVIWVVGEALGGVLTGQGTDPYSGPLLALLAAVFWPLRIGNASPARELSSAGAPGPAIGQQPTAHQPTAQHG
ncbi:hypothetical protein MSM1_06455 [Mycobacterium sp. SM1]|uniref:hypothetical protein n=1 Tax=Mycobacterium sp. SM1 TaxID=2816243 RepID=UPI001BCEED60|nr:hypothetical protein [Mycobacterium sp. SM1]MBS4728005.1 hypothetical protein [Mycobacterium sp. SM1]